MNKTDDKCIVTAKSCILIDQMRPQKKTKKTRLTFGAFFALSSLTLSPWAAILSLRSELPLDGADVCWGTVPGFHSCPVAVL